MQQTPLILTRCFLLLASGLMASLTAMAGPSTTPDSYQALRPQLVDQREFQPNACGPCAMYHALLFGGPSARQILLALPGREAKEKINHLMRVYGSRHSTMLYGKSMLHDGGLHWQDAGVLMNAMLKDHGGPVLASVHLERESGDNHLAHLRKVHRLLRESLEADWPPVISLRSYVASFDSRRGGVVWSIGSSHYVTLIELGDLEHAEDGGFMFRYIDPLGAKRQQGFVHIERQRDFMAHRTLTQLGEWVGDAPFLTVTVPFTRLIEKEVPLHLRSVVTLHHAIAYQPPPQEHPAQDATDSP